MIACNIENNPASVRVVLCFLVIAGCFLFWDALGDNFQGIISNFLWRVQHTPEAD
jgi:hypothetical protein